jgi:hypothetical protein
MNLDSMKRILLTNMKKKIRQSPRGPQWCVHTYSRVTPNWGIFVHFQQESVITNKSFATARIQL